MRNVTLYAIGLAIVTAIVTLTVLKSNQNAKRKIPMVELEQNVRLYNENEYQVVTKLYRLKDGHKFMIGYMDTWCKQNQTDSVKLVQAKMLQHDIDSLNVTQ